MTMMAATSETSIPLNMTAQAYHRRVSIQYLNAKKACTKVAMIALCKFVNNDFSV